MHFPDAAARERITRRGFYHLRGKVAEEFGVYSLEVGWMEQVGLRGGLSKLAPVTIRMDGYELGD